MSSKTGDLDVDPQGQISFEISKILVYFFKNLTLQNFIFKLELLIDHLNVSYDFKIW